MAGESREIADKRNKRETKARPPCSDGTAWSAYGNHGRNGMGKEGESTNGANLTNLSASHPACIPLKIWYTFLVTFNYAEFFERRQELCGGALVVRGTRVPVRTLLASLAEGDFPTGSPAWLRAVVAFAAASAGEDLPLPPVPAVPAVAA